MEFDEKQSKLVQEFIMKYNLEEEYKTNVQNYMMKNHINYLC